MRDPRPDLAAAGMPRRDRKSPPGLEPKGSPQPNRHEVAILRRLGRRGAFVMVTQREGKVPLYTYEDGRPILGAGGEPLSPGEFRRFTGWLDPVRGEGLFDFGPPQRWVARRAPP
jgi:hypothetical protein